MLKVWGVLVLVFALMVSCGDDEGTKKTEEEKKKEEKKKEDKKKEEAKKKADDKKKMAITEAEIKKTKAYKDLDKQLKDKAKELIALQTKRKPAKTYLWAAAAAVAGNWAGGTNRTNVDAYCSGAAAADDPAVLGVGRPAIITNDNADYVTKALALSHAINNFEMLGAAALTAGAHKDSLSDPVYGLSSSGFSETILADDYEKFRTEAWKTSLFNARVAILAATEFWIGAIEEGTDATAGTKHATFYNCQNFNTNAAGTTEDLDEGTFILGGTIRTDHNGGGGADSTEVSPLRLRNGEDGAAAQDCDQTAVVLCISFSKK